ncbi:MAG: isochorismate synthase [bacterium]|nr:isochorismate synthase [bacterium]
MITRGVALDAACDSLFVLLNQLKSDSQHTFPVFKRLEVPCENVDVKRWLAAQKNLIQWYWSPRNSSEEVGGIGAAVAVDSRLSKQVAFSTMTRILDAVPEAFADRVRFYGGLSFNGQAPEDEQWASFGSHFFVLPQLELVVGQDGAQMALQIWCESASDWERELGAAELMLGAVSFCEQAHVSESFVAMHVAPNFETWRSNVESVTSRIRAGKLNKLVLSRRSDFVFERPVCPYFLLSRLQEADSNAFHFCMANGGGAAFIGGTPERLFSVDDGALLTEALAGTRRRGKTPEEDDALAHALVTSEKDVSEHQYVADYLMDCLGQLCSDYSAAEERRLLKLPMIQHLLMRFSGGLRPNVGVLDVLAALHPTPAVGGVPREVALEMLPEFESFERGWFAGPVGWVSKHACEFVVAIRSGLVSGDNVTLYSGAGIVADSDATEEWHEVENKIGLFVRLFSGA